MCALNAKKKAAAKKPAAKNTKATSKKESPKKSNPSGAGASGFLAAAKTVAGNWKKARDVEPTNAGKPDIEDGSYVAKLTDAVPGVREVQVKEGKVTKKVKVPNVRYSFQITKGEYKGTKLSRIDSFDEKNAERSSANIQRLGYETEDVEMSDLPDLFAQIKEDAPVVKLAVKNNGEYLNVYINGIVGDDDEDEDEDEDAEDEDTDEEESEDEEEEESEDEDDDMDEDEEEEDEE